MSFIDINKQILHGATTKATIVEGSWNLSPLCCLYASRKAPTYRCGTLTHRLTPYTIYYPVRLLTTAPRFGNWTAPGPRAANQNAYVCKSFVFFIWLYVSYTALNEIKIIKVFARTSNESILSSQNGTTSKEGSAAGTLACGCELLSFWAAALSFFVSLCVSHRHERRRKIQLRGLTYTFLVFSYYYSPVNRIHFSLVVAITII